MEQTQQRAMTAHQTLLLQMLKDLDAVCRRHQISYQLFSGTALGAVRHKGFIPWDDDLDVLLSRQNYTRLLAALEQDLDQETYFVQREFGDHWPMQFSKLRRNGTACMEKYHPKDPLLHQGVWIDIFPYDDLSDHSFMRLAQFLASKVVIAKALDARGYATRNPAKRVFLTACRLLPAKPFWRLCVKQRPGSGMVHTFFAGARKYRKNVFPRAWLDQTELLAFEDGLFPVSRAYDQVLTRLYGDYHRLPTEAEKQKKQHVAILDLERSYTCYLDRQRNMTFDTHTRSIR